MANTKIKSMSQICDLCANKAAKNIHAKLSASIEAAQSWNYIAR